VSVPADRHWPPIWARALAGDEVDEAAIYLALEAASWPIDLAPGERRAFALLVLASVDARAEGATRLSLAPADLDPRLVRLGGSADDRSGARLLAGQLGAHLALSPLVGRPGDYRPFILDGGFLYQERDLHLETRLADALALRLARSRIAVTGPDAARALAAAAKRDRRWTSAQAAALDAALRRPLTVVAGGPGSGKTALIGGIVRAWRALGIAAEAIAIAAPTGKAANRIAEVLADEAPGAPVPGTLHRLLGFSPGRPSLRGGEFRHHENRPLPQAAVIVDEASMVGLPLLEQLARALRPDARLVLLGDADQLPAIQAGSVFRDLGALAIRLTESHRMNPDAPAGAGVLEAARAIAAGRPALAGGAGARSIDDLQFSAFELLEPAAGPSAGRRLVSSFVDRWYTTWLRPSVPDRVALRRVFGLRDGVLDSDGAEAAAPILDRHRRQRLLTVTRVGFTGSERINAALARRAADEAGLAVAPDELAPGTPVMMTGNDYDRGLHNGDQGLVLRAAAVAGAPSAVAVFPRGGALVSFPLATLRGALAVAYAMTVHKAQGSELDRAALILPEIDLPLLSRELIYTAVTRARYSIVVVGRRALFEQAVARPLDRSSGLAERLAARGALPESGAQPRP
jgi:exodeoxyribonuclease V alpha subunit